MLGIIFLLCFFNCACSSLITCPGRENEITDCAIDLTKLCATTGCPEGQFCCRYGCGKQTCQSNDTLPGSKCEIGTPKSSTNCGRGGVRCDEGFKCNIAPDDRYAVCCPENPCAFGDPLPKTLCNSNKAGCPKGYDCAKTADERYSVCCLGTCFQPKLVGPCEALIPRWYYDQKTGTCKHFKYGGCQGNQNNFETKDACKARCMKDACSQPKVVGPCRAAIKRWYFNSQTKQCEMFIYGGCKGNDNNFKSDISCKEKCMKELDPCSQPKVTGPCRAAFKRWFFNSKTQKCEVFIYGGCQGNDNNFNTKMACMQRCMKKLDQCLQPKKPGPCRGSFPRWYFNWKTKKCERFIYGGCQGNDNNFTSKRACLKICKKKKDPCLQTKKIGPCKAAIPRWYYNSKTKTCKKFIYGGCQGNDNNFQTESACMARCTNNLDKCLQPKDPGPCLAAFPRWYFNDMTAKCEKFIYGGCLGNDNNFLTLQACAKACRKFKDPCRLPKKTGPCLALFRRWYFNWKKNRCERFIYGGCQGNKNNFKSKPACRRKCRRKSYKDCQ